MGGNRQRKIYLKRHLTADFVMLDDYWAEFWEIFLLMVYNDWRNHLWAIFNCAQCLNGCTVTHSWLLRNFHLFDTALAGKDWSIHFSHISSLLNLLCNMAIELTIERFLPLARHWREGTEVIPLVSFGFAGGCLREFALEFVQHYLVEWRILSGWGEREGGWGGGCAGVCGCI